MKFRLIVRCVILAQILTVSVSGKTLPEFPTRVYTIDGDIYIGATFSVHQYSSSESCSRRSRGLGVLQRMEALIYAVKEVNENNDLLPNISLGLHIVDICSKDITSQDQALRFVKIRSRDSCDDSQSPLFVGVIGAENSKNTMALASLFTLYKIPLLSYASTSPLLSDKNKYPYFVRTASSDTYQMLAILDILNHFHWDYFSLVYAEGSYGEEAYKILKTHSKNLDLCMEAQVVIHQSDSMQEYESAVEYLVQKKNARVVILVILSSEADKFFKAVKRLGYDGIFTWIGSDGWGYNAEAFVGLENVAEGSITLKLLSSSVPRFDRYIQNVKPSQSKNQWLKEYVSDTLECDFNSSTTYGRNCNTSMKIKDMQTYAIHGVASVVFDAVYAFAHALDDVIKNTCRNLTETSIKSCLTSDRIIMSFHNLSFAGEVSKVSFDEFGDGQSGYVLQNLQIKNGTLIVQPVGTWSPVAPRIILTKKIVFHPDVPYKYGVPKSVCSDPCKVGYQRIAKISVCCWVCENCRNYERVVDFIGASKCQSCPHNQPFTWPNENRTSCETISFTVMSIFDALGSITALLVTIPCVCTFCLILATHCLGRIIRHHGTISYHIDLNYILSVGIFHCILSVFLNLFRYIDEICILCNILTYPSYTAIYGPLAIWAIIYRSSEYKISQKIIATPCTRIITALLPYFLHVTVSGVWTAVYVPMVTQAMPSYSEKYVELTCTTDVGASILSITYNMVCCFVIRVLITRILPHQLCRQDVKLMRMLADALLVLWICYIPLYMMTTIHWYLLMIQNIILVINIYLVIGFILIPKVYKLYKHTG